MAISQIGGLLQVSIFGNTSRICNRLGGEKKAGCRVCIDWVVPPNQKTLTVFTSGVKSHSLEQLSTSSKQNVRLIWTPSVTSIEEFFTTMWIVAIVPRWPNGCDNRLINRCWSYIPWAFQWIPSKEPEPFRLENQRPFSPRNGPISALVSFMFGSFGRGWKHLICVVNSGVHGKRDGVTSAGDEFLRRGKWSIWYDSMLPLHAHAEMFHCQLEKPVNVWLKHISWQYINILSISIKALVRIYHNVAKSDAGHTHSSNKYSKTALWRRWFESFLDIKFTAIRGSWKRALHRVQKCAESPSALSIDSNKSTRMPSSSPSSSPPPPPSPSPSPSPSSSSSSSSIIHHPSSMTPPTIAPRHRHLLLDQSTSSQYPPTSKMDGWSKSRCFWRKCWMERPAATRWGIPIPGCRACNSMAKESSI